MLVLGYAVFMPDSFQRPGRRACRQAGPMAQRIEIRKEEVEHALSKIRQLSWVDQNRVILMGFSEGGNTTDNWDEKGFAAHIILGSACTFTGTGMPAAPKGTPVLAVVGEQDDHRPGESCHVIRKVGGSKSISLPDAGHKIAHRAETKAAIITFLRECCSFAKRNNRPDARKAPAAMKNLSEAEIRKTVIGNTIKFIAPSNGKYAFVYFAEDGKAQIKMAGNEKLFKRKWFFDDRGLLCRTTGRQNRSHCTKVRATGNPDTIFMYNKNQNYEAKIFKGRHLSK